MIWEEVNFKCLPLQEGEEDAEEDSAEPEVGRYDTLYYYYFIRYILDIYIYIIRCDTHIDNAYIIYIIVYMYIIYNAVVYCCFMLDTFAYSRSFRNL